MDRSSSARQSDTRCREAMERWIPDRRRPGGDDLHEFVGDPASPERRQDGDGSGTVVVDCSDGDEPTSRHDTEPQHPRSGELLDQRRERGASGPAAGAGTLVSQLPEELVELSMETRVVDGGDEERRRVHAAQCERGACRRCFGNVSRS